MRKLWLVVKWFFSYNGMSKEPSWSLRLGWARLGRPVLELRCRVCKRTFWAVSRKQVCPRLACYLAWHNGERAWR